jgi:hypothetical protein
MFESETTAPRDKRFNMLCTAQELRKLSDLAASNDMNASDLVRMLIRLAVVGAPLTKKTSLTKRLPRRKKRARGAK